MQVKKFSFENFQRKFNRSSRIVTEFLCVLLGNINTHPLLGDFLSYSAIQNAAECCTY